MATETNILPPRGNGVISGKVTPIYSHVPTGTLSGTPLAVIPAKSGYRVLILNLYMHSTLAGDLTLTTSASDEVILTAEFTAANSSMAFTGSPWGICLSQKNEGVDVNKGEGVLNITVVYAYILD